MILLIVLLNCLESYILFIIFLLLFILSLLLFIII